MDLQEIDRHLPKGKVTRFGQKVKSEDFIVNGEKSRWHLAGKYDLLSENENGTASLIDCKVSKSEDSQSGRYAPQLEAYVFALEHPASGDPEIISSMGLLKWNPDHVMGDSPTTYGFGISQEYEEVARDVDGFYRLMAACIEMLEGPLPNSGEKCTTCNYINDRNAIGL